MVPSAAIWSHWWCSPSGAHGGTVHHLSAGLLLAHWPHFLPVVLALATLVYLHRANRRYHAE
ncbi:MAG TPA: hypothetical protein VMU55_08245 [Solirubrobacteraceae bacterium]|nr:hypothetical protein [Solirubrobacteraceae bacterium]